MKEKYNMLIPLEFSHMNNHHKSVWKFKCDCGKYKICVLADVKSGRTQSCGCLQKQTGIQNGFLRTIYLEGQKFEEFEVIKRNTDKSFKYNSGARYLCICKCGEKFETFGSSILRGKAKRCRTCQYKFNGYATQKKRAQKKSDNMESTSEKLDVSKKT